MGMTMQDERGFDDILRMLQEQPALRERLRQLLLTRELLELPRTVAGLAEAVSRLERQVERLAQAQERAGERLSAVETRLGSLEERVERLEGRVERLEGRVDRLEEAIVRLAEAQARTEEELRTLARRVTDLDARFTGDYLERRYREHACSYFAPILRHIRLVERHRLWELLDEGMEAGIVSPDEARDTSLVDVLVEGRTPEGERAFLAVEVSATVYPEDVESVLRRREVLSRCLGAPVLAAVAGEAIHREAEEMAQPHLYRVVDGVAVKPGLPAPARAIIRPPR